ncbi:MAG: adenylate/guanylate cyclase domain-containing protein [Bacteroidia bacterium]
MMKIISKINQWIETYAEPFAEDVYKKRQVVILIRACFITGLFMFMYLGVSYVIDFHTGVKILPFEGILFLILPFMFKLGFSQAWVGNAFVFVGTSFGILLVINSGGLYSPVMPWLTLTPITGLLFVGRRSAWTWAFILLFITLVMAALWYFNGALPKNYNTSSDLFFFTNCYGGLIFIYLSLNLIFEYALNKANKLLEKQNLEIMAEKQLSENLLLNILPEEVALELKEKGKAEARLFNEVTVLFTDFVGFTNVAEKLSPTELVAEIHKNFTAFDNIIEKHGLEKIKTIGDAYLAVCGMPQANPNHAMQAVQAAIEIRAFMRNQQNGQFQIRIGIHTGPVVAGIVGVKKYAYDIWGDTVNTAARMEQNCEPGKINISGNTYELIKSKIACEHRGKIAAKGKGDIDMYFVSES